MPTTEEAMLNVLESDAAVQAHCGATPGTRIHPLVLPQDPTLSAITYQRIANDPMYSSDGADGLDRVRMQLDVWAASYEGAKQLVRAVKNALEAAQSAAFSAQLLTENDFYENAPRLYRVSLDYSIWYAEV